MLKSCFFEPYEYVWVKIQPPGIGPQVGVLVSIYQGNPFWIDIFDPQPSETRGWFPFQLRLGAFAKWSMGPSVRELRFGL